MRAFTCDYCQNQILFENNFCQTCGHSYGFDVIQSKMIVLLPNYGSWVNLLNHNQQFKYCENHIHAVCNWLIPIDSDSKFCEACKLNNKIPNLSVAGNLDAWQKLEKAKHRLVYSLHRLGLPVKSKSEAGAQGISFNFLSDDQSVKKVKTGHLQGVITINIKEADSVHREFIRIQMGEPYRTLIGHFRHEIGHFYWDNLVNNNLEYLYSFRNLFGDERLDYTEALKIYYQKSTQPFWFHNHITEYASSHPWEDWAETWAHYMHLLDTMETAYSVGMELKINRNHLGNQPVNANFDPYVEQDFDKIISNYTSITFAINSLNRGMGLPDLYPFEITKNVENKLRFIHNLVRNNGRFY